MIHEKKRCEYCKQLYWKKHNCFGLKLHNIVIEHNKPNKHSDCLFYKIKECNGTGVDCVFEVKQ